jgi:hypothetical protein
MKTTGIFGVIGFLTVFALMIAINRPRSDL